MFKKVISAVIALTMVMGMCSCGDSSGTADAKQTKEKPSAAQQQASEPVNVPISPTSNYQFAAASENTTDDKFIAGTNEFSVELFKNTVLEDLKKGQNTLVSPESVLFAMGMVSNGANGETLRQMQKVLCKDLDTDTFNKNMNKLISDADKSEAFKFRIANSLWVKDTENLTLSEQFAKNCKELYNADMFKAPFNDETIRQINDWVNKKTDSMIPEMIKQFGDNTGAVLLNSIAFDAEWKNNYEKNDVNENGEFTLENGRKVKCSLMNSMEKGYIRDGSAEGFIKKYKGEKYAFMAILPDKGVSLSDYVRSLTAEKFARLYNSRNNNESVIASLPKFKYDYSTCLNDPLKQMGIADVFDPSKSDLSGITDRYKMYISNVAHKTHIEVNEQGTKAAAATEIQLDVSGALPADMHTVSLDRPFAYAIVNTETGMPIFMGTVCNPNA